ncbi:MAG: pyridoxamine 5'-phosphate oxidase [Flavobacteriales bacterium]|nr:pyridoxamine 5'-phosphate oxidase [Flavobacteriales bacterium]
MDIKNLRLNYKKSTIDFKNLAKNPIQYFMNWFEDALKVSKQEANACVLSTISSDNYPSSRVVLLKEVNESGFTFFTNYKSSKAKDIDANPNVALNFYWPELERQVRIEGIAKKIMINDSDTYFKSRPRESQMGAWLSDQSKVIGLDYNFIETLNSLESKFKDKEVERPLHWGGYCIEPIKIEFWQGRPSRLHDRLDYKREDGKWIYKRLAP